MKYNIFFTFSLALGRFFHGYGFFRIGSGFLADPDTDLEKKSDPDPGKKIRIRNTVLKTDLFLFFSFWNV